MHKNVHAQNFLLNTHHIYINHSINMNVIALYASAEVGPTANITNFRNTRQNYHPWSL